MGNYQTTIGVFLLSAVGIVSSAHAEDNKLLQRLEKGEVISSKTGSSFFIQALVNKEPEKIQAALSDLKKLPSIFPQIAVSRPYVGANGRQFLYLKLRGLGDGISILTEVKSGGGEAFVNAKELIQSADYGASRNTASEVDTSKEANELQLRKEVDAENSRGSSNRTFGVSRGIVLEGPLNEVMQLPNVRITINLGFSAYTESTPSSKSDFMNFLMAAPAPTKKSYMVAKISFGNQVVKGELGDYRGFGEQRLRVAEQVGNKVFAALKGSLEK